MATHFLTSSAPEVWAKIGVAKASSAKSMNNFVFIVMLLLYKIRLQEVVPVIL
jgi:hypothetical protein